MQKAVNFLSDEKQNCLSSEAMTKHASPDSGGEMVFFLQNEGSEMPQMMMMWKHSPTTFEEGLTVTVVSQVHVSHLCAQNRKKKHSFYL